MDEIKRTARQSAIIVFSVLLVFTPTTIWEHGGSVLLTDLMMILVVPFLWYAMDVYLWPKIFNRQKKRRKLR